MACTSLGEKTVERQCWLLGQGWASHVVLGEEPHGPGMGEKGRPGKSLHHSDMAARSDCNLDPVTNLCQPATLTDCGMSLTWY